MNLPGYKFHQLKGSRKNEFAVSVTGNWQITFEFIGEDAINVNLEDYHCRSLYVIQTANLHTLEPCFGKMCCPRRAEPKRNLLLD